MYTIHLLHISDLHIKKHYRMHREKQETRIYRFNCVANSVNEYRDFLDGYLITGDIAETGRSDDLHCAKQYLFKSDPFPVTPSKNPYMTIYPLNLNDKKTILLPGNHDRFGFPVLQPGSKTFDSIFQEQWKNEVDGNTIHFLPNDQTPRILVVCVDFSLKSWHDAPTGKQWFGRGNAYPERLKKLGQITESISKKYDEIPVIWAMHFAPDMIIDGKNSIPRFLRLKSSDKLIRKAKDKKVKYIFCGHYHGCINYPKNNKNQVAVYCSGSPTKPEKNTPPSLQLIKIVLKDNIIYKLDVIPLIHDGFKFKKIQKNEKLR